MIDTDQYEGHTPTEEWGDIVYADGYLPIFLDDDVYATDLDRQLMADAPLLFEEVKRLRELLVEAAHCIHEMEGMAYADADPDDFAKHAMEFRGNVSETIGADAPWGVEE